MLRRDLLKLGAASFLPRIPGPEVTDFGWRKPDSKIKVASFPGFSLKRQKILLHRFFEVATQRILVPHSQDTVDCTSQAWGLGVDITQAIQAVLKKERWVKKVATELLHIGGREIIGGRRRGGVAISETAKFVRDYGNVYRTIYPPFDFTEYSLSNIKQIDKKSERQLQPLLNEAKAHQVQSFNVHDADEACRAMSNLCPVVMGSSYAFYNQRDAHGFAERNPNKVWMHAWLLLGFDTKYPRPGALVISSWGPNWISGPKREQPDGSFWVDMDTLDSMISEHGDAAGISNFEGVQ